MANKEFGEILRQLRKQKGYTQQQAAQLLGLKNKSTLGSWEVGKSEPDAYTFLRLCSLYEVRDLYASFHVEPPAFSVPSLHPDQFLLLRSDYREIIKKEIEHMLILQKEAEELL
ncbi:MAG: helix-turn-helix transcriptional regulator [Oscillospiraceae bacterium]|nr:helix-turn-helix transcriptional regulator [Oscillospiraceae bacterium]